MHNTPPSMQPAPRRVLLSRYQADIKAGKLQPDPFQKAVIHLLQRLYNQLIEQEQIPARRSFFDKLFSPTAKANASTPKGLYIWGDVGRGKTHLVNYFYHLLPIENKLRLHFHRFMQLVHEELEKLHYVSDPLQHVAQHFAAKAQVLCLDEMLVNDITDAMLLGRLFKYLLEQKTVLVITSNTPPHKLYQNGLQREKFLPAIQLIEQNTEVIELAGQLDYRLQTMTENEMYLDAKNSQTDKKLQQAFASLAGIELHSDRTDIIINKRRIPVIRWADSVVWLHFNTLCSTARSAADYHQIGIFFRTVIISQIPVMNDAMEDSARRFITLIDTLYDLHTNLIISANAEPEQLYQGKKLSFEFKRTASRLREMQTPEYIAAVRQ